MAQEPRRRGFFFILCKVIKKSIYLQLYMFVLSRAELHDATAVRVYVPINEPITIGDWVDLVLSPEVQYKI